MGFTSDAYLKSLYQSLGIKNKDEITDAHSKKIIEFIENHPNPIAIKELLLALPDFLKFAQNQLEEMVKVSNKIIESGDKDISHLTTIITSYNELLKSSSIGEEEKKRIIDLLFEYQKTLAEKLERNDTLKQIIYAGAFTLAAISLFIVGNWVNTALGNRIDPDSLKRAAEKIAEKS